MSTAVRTQQIDGPFPYSREAERTILGAVILDNRLLTEAAEMLIPADFYLQVLNLIFRAMLALNARNAEVNPILLREELHRKAALEQAGGPSFISELTYGLPSLSSLAPYAGLVRKKAMLRRLAKFTYNVHSAALNEEDELAALLERMRGWVSESEEEYARLDGAPLSLMTPFDELMRQNLEDGEEIGCHARRGEIAIVQSVTNHGKSTLVRNMACAFATGRSFDKLLVSPEPRRILLLNFEGSGGWFLNDLRVMTRDFTRPEMDLLAKNFYAAHAPTLDREPLSFSRHMRALEEHVMRKGGVDVLIIDTVSAAFSLRNENDNAEVANFVMKPLVSLARRLNCLIIFVHHVGKAKAEEGVAREQAHRGRGASAWGDFSTSIFNLDADAHDQSKVTLTCGKRKDGERYQTVLRLDRELRWFTPTVESAVKPMTSDDLVINALRNSGLSEMRKSDIVRKLTGIVRARTVTACLERLLAAGRVMQPRRGWWALAEIGQVGQPLIEGA